MAERTSTTGERWLFWFVLAAVPAVKVCEVLIDRFDEAHWVWVRQGFLVGVLALLWFFGIMQKDKTHGAYAAGLIPLVGARARPGRPSADESTRTVVDRCPRMLCGALSLAAAFAAVAVDKDLAGWRYVATGVAGGLLVLLVWLEYRNYHGAARPDLEPLQRWESVVVLTVAPLVLSLGATAIILTVRGEAPHISQSQLVELIFVTAIGEELIFRGFLLAWATRSFGFRTGSWWVALSFGLWHVGDAINDASSPFANQLFLVAVTVVATAIAGTVLTWSRLRTLWLLGPVLLHIAINYPGLALGTKIAAGG